MTKARNSRVAPRQFDAVVVRRITCGASHCRTTRVKCRYLETRQEVPYCEVYQEYLDQVIVRRAIPIYEPERCWQCHQAENN